MSFLWLKSHPAHIHWSLTIVENQSGEQTVENKETNWERNSILVCRLNSFIWEGFTQASHARHISVLLAGSNVSDSYISSIGTVLRQLLPMRGNYWLQTTRHAAPAGLSGNKQTAEWTECDFMLKSLACIWFIAYLTGPKVQFSDISWITMAFNRPEKWLEVSHCSTLSLWHL